MSEIANVEYFWNKASQELHIPIKSTIKEPINLEWLVATVKDVYGEIHGPKPGCTLTLSAIFDSNELKIAADKDLVDTVISYLTKFNRECDDDCNCTVDSNCECVCASHCTCSGNCSGNCNGACTGNSQCNCNCTCGTCSNCNCKGAYQCNCACENANCGSDSECDCFSSPYECNCDQPFTNCDPPIGANPSTENCGSACNCGTANCCQACACNCECNCGW